MTRKGVRNQTTLPLCPYCSGESERVGGLVIYPHRPDLADKWFYLCRPCWAYVGCHPSSSRPLGRLADAELRRAKKAAHAAFDALWKARIMSRTNAYKWLSVAVGVPSEQCHIGMFDVEQCNAVIAAVKARSA